MKKTDKEISAEEDLFWYAPQSFCATRQAQYEHRALLSLVNDFLRNVLEFHRYLLIINIFRRFQKPFRTPNVPCRQRKGVGETRF